MTGSLDPHYDVILVGTSLPNSILSAALSKAGYSVLHVDEADHYGGLWASLTLEELLAWSQDVTTRRQEELWRLNRHFSLSLVPTLLPSRGPTIDVLVRSKVASYCTFRLLERTTVYSDSRHRREEWPLRRVPSSKEDIFKDKKMALGDKRKLMKLLQQTVDSTREGEEEGKESDEKDDQPFLNYLVDKSGPGLSEELASDVAFGVALCSTDQDPTWSALQRIKTHILSMGRYGNSAYLVGQYGGAGEMAQCFCRASAVQGGTFVLAHHIKALGKKAAKRKEKEGKESGRWALSLDGIGDRTSSDWVIGDSGTLNRLLCKKKDDSQPQHKTGTVLLRGILVLDRGLRFVDDIDAPPSSEETPTETALLLFPPVGSSTTSSTLGSVTALQMGEGTFSCPKGTYVIYLSSQVETSSDSPMPDARELLKEVRDRILELAANKKREWHSELMEKEEAKCEKRIEPLVECYYSQKLSEASSEDQDPSSENLIRIPFPPCPNTTKDSHLPTGTSLPTYLDLATEQAEKAFWKVVGPEKESLALQERTRKRRQRSGYAVGQGLGGVVEEPEQASEGQEGEAESIVDFFPDEEIGDDAEE